MDLYDLLPVRIDDVQVLFITPREVFSDVSSIKKHMEKLHASTGCFVSLLLNDISEAQNKRELPTTGFATKFNLSEMTTTRALRQL